MSRVRAPATLSYRDRSHLSTNDWGSSTRASPAGSGRSTPSNSNPGGQRYVDDLEGQNDEAIDGLAAKVKLLKSVSLGIGNELKDSAVQLSQMNDAFAETGGILSGTFRRMNDMAKRQGGRWACYMLFLILVFWIFVVVWLFG